jgi:hypothetical protein
VGHAVWNGAGSGTAQPAVVHAVWNGAGSGTAQFPPLHGAATASPVPITNAKAAKIKSRFMVGPFLKVRVARIKKTPHHFSNRFGDQPL